MEQRIIKKFPDYTITENGVIYDSNNNIVKTFINAAGHVSAVLNDRIVTVAYLVANTYLKNDNLMIVGFRDNDRTNIKASNLYWYYEGEEESPQIHFDNIYFNKEKYVGLIDINGNVIRKYLCAEDAGADWKNIGKVSDAISTRKLIDGKYIFVKLNNYRKENFERDYKEYFSNRRSKYRKLTDLDRTIYTDKKVIRYDYNGNVIKVYNNINEAAKELNAVKQSIARVCRGQLITSYNSIWRFEGDAFDRYKTEKRRNVSKDKTVLQIDINGDIIKEYKNIKEAQTKLKLSNGSYTVSSHSLLNDNSLLIKKEEYNKETFERDLKPYFSIKRKINRDIIMYDLTGNILNKFESVKEAAEQTGIQYNTMINCLTNRQKKVYGKYIFKYDEK